MNKFLKITSIILLFIIIMCIVIVNTVTFPLAAGTTESGKKAIESLYKQSLSRRLKNYRFVAAIVEPRVDNLEFIIQHYIDKLPDYTHFQVYYGSNNKHILTKFSEYIDSGKMSIWDMNVDNLTIQSYSYLLTSETFWRTIQSENVLIFQTDSITCSQSPFDITQFYKYDFIGAPLTPYVNNLLSFYFLCQGYLINSHSMNGGLSFRKKSKMLDVIKYYPWNELITEDVWFCINLPKVGGNLPPREVAEKFSYESCSNINVIPWGVHKPLKNHDILQNICPEINHIPTLNSHSNYKNLFML